MSLSQRVFCGRWRICGHSSVGVFVGTAPLDVGVFVGTAPLAYLLAYHTASGMDVMAYLWAQLRWRVIVAKSAFTCAAIVQHVVGVGRQLVLRTNRAHGTEPEAEDGSRNCASTMVVQLAPAFRF